MKKKRRRIQRVGLGRTSFRRREMHRTAEEKKSLKRKALALLLALAAVGSLSAILLVTVDRREIFSLEQFLHPDLYNTVEIGGVRCRRKTRVKSYLFMGVDARGKVGEHVEEDGAGQCDVLELVIVDQNADTYTVFPISRDILTPVTTVDENGEVIAESTIQLAFAHVSGDGGGEISCQNVVRAVSRLLYDQPIDGYLALNMDSISIINHQLGGVTVTIQDDFSDSDPSLKMGETVKLTDEQAVLFVRGRMEVADGTNKNRMGRQEQFLEAAQPILEQKIMEDVKFFRGLYDALDEYMVTSLTGKDISKLAKAFRSNEYFEHPQIRGEMSVDEFGFTQMKVDAESIADAVRELFYEEV